MGIELSRQRILLAGGRRGRMPDFSQSNRNGAKDGKDLFQDALPDLQSSACHNFAASHPSGGGALSRRPLTIAAKSLAETFPNELESAQSQTTVPGDVPDNDDDGDDDDDNDEDDYG